MVEAVVLGGNGFLGSYLVDALTAAGHRVTVFDRFSRPDALFSSPGIERVAGSIADRDAVRRVLEGKDVAFQFVGSTTPASSVVDALSEVQTEVSASVPFLDAAVDAGVGRVVFASTGGAIYGEAGDEDLAVSEQVPPAPISPYGIGKLAVEGFLRYYALAHGLDTISLRIANPYGSRQPEGRHQGLIPIVLRNVLASRPTPVLGDGSMIRDYIYAPDVARQAARLADADHEHSVYNIGSGEGRSISQVIEIVEALTGRAVEIERRPPVTGFVSRSVLDVDRFDQEFGRTALVGIRDGIAATWHELRSGASA